MSLENLPIKEYRTPNIDLVRDREARRLLAPLREKLAGWQQDAAHLTAESFHLAARHQSLDDITSRSRAFALKVIREFERDTAGLSAVAESGRYEDIRRSYESLLATLRRLQQ
jgi:hypothetical protein